MKALKKSTCISKSEFVFQRRLLMLVKIVLVKKVHIVEGGERQCVKFKGEPKETPG